MFPQMRKICALYDWGLEDINLHVERDELITNIEGCFSSAKAHSDNTW